MLRHVWQKRGGQEADGFDELLLLLIPAACLAVSLLSFSLASTPGRGQGSGLQHGQTVPC